MKVENLVLSIEVENGTEWLNLGGDLDDFIPIVTAPSQHVATSDLSLQHAMQRISDINNSNIAVFVFFKSQEIIGESLDIISSNIDNETPVLVRGQSYYILKNSYQGSFWVKLNRSVPLTRATSSTS